MNRRTLLLGAALAVGLAGTAFAQDKVKVGFDPLPAGFYTVPFDDAPALAAAVGERTAAVLLEPIQG